jgi:hypothetical protein
MTSPKLPALREFARLFRIHVLKQNT